MSSRSVSDMLMFVFFCSCFFFFAHILSYLKNDPSYEFIGEVILKINIVQAEKMKAEVYVTNLYPIYKHWLNIYFFYIFLVNN
jgi:hypothetical protein